MSRVTRIRILRASVGFLILTIVAGCDPTDMNEQYALAEKYEKGDGVTPDNSVAVRWYRAAAEQGHIVAQHKLGCLYDNGQGVLENDSEAIKWFELAARNGHAPSQVSLGMKYVKGDGVSKNYNEAIRLFQEAANISFPMGLMMLGQMYDKGIGLDEDNEKALELYTAAAAKGLAEASELAVEVHGEMSSDKMAELVEKNLRENVARINEQFRVMSEPVHGAIGDEIGCVGMALYVYQVISQEAHYADQPPAGYYRIAAEIAVRNDAQANPLTVGPSSFSVEDNAGGSWSYRGISPTTTFGFHKLDTGEVCRGWIAFDVPVRFRSGYLVMSLSLAGAPIKVRIP